MSHANITRRYHRKRHDYYYIPAAWTESVSGTTKSGGYYDETGMRYDAIADFDAASNEYYTADEFQCGYCGSQIKVRWTAGAAPQCPNCGAALQKVAYDEKADEVNLLPDGTQEWIEGNTRYRIGPNGSSYSQSPVNAKPLMIGLVLFFTLPWLAINGFSVLIQNSDKWEEVEPGQYQYVGERTIKTEENKHEPIYVDALGREIKWDSASGNYYDASTDCYAYRNKIDGAWVWQYWYEGISSNYESGWMEWDTEESRWYIETTDNHWEPLPDKYISDRLWHMG